jgi:hypothetical protein
MADVKITKTPMYPGHVWGKMAKDPWMPIGSDSEANRQVLRRYWLRNNGEGDAFDSLMPPREPEDVRTPGVGP